MCSYYATFTFLFFIISLIDISRLSTKSEDNLTLTFLATIFPLLINCNPQKARFTKNKLRFNIKSIIFFKLFLYFFKLLF